MIIFTFLSLAFAAQHTPVCNSIAKAMAKQKAPAQKLQTFLDLQWKDWMTQYPAWATETGYPGQNDRWPDYSPEAIEARRKDTTCELAVLQTIPSQSLHGEARINYNLNQRNLQREIESFQFDDDYLVLNHLNGLQIFAPDILSEAPTATKKDYEDRIARLEKIPEIENQHENLLREGLKCKVTPVKMLLTRIPAQFEKLLTKNVEDSPLYKSFKNIQAPLTDAEKTALQQRARDVIQNKTYPAFIRLREFLTKEYIPGATDNIALSSKPNGKAWYAFSVKLHTTTNMTPEQLHELGVKEVARITGEMEKIKDDVKFKGDLKAFNKFLLTDKRFYYDDKDKLLMGYRDIAKRIDPELPRLFKTLPRLTYGVMEMPAFKAVDAPGAYYEPGSLDSGRAGYFEANTTDLPGRPKWGMEALTLHEAVPGHHLQIALAQELKDLPKFRREGQYTAFIEGWGLYAEGLGKDLGLYKDPYSHYGQLSYEMWRAIRLVVDTGIHSQGWTRQQAIDYFTEHMPKAPKEIANEVDRYITWPGQALAYKVGELKFRELRAQAQKQLGDQFDLREFHEQLLSHGALPMDVLEKSMSDWLKSKKPANAQVI